VRPDELNFVTPPTVHKPHSSEDIDWSDNSEAEGPSEPKKPKKEKRKARRLGEICSNNKILQLKCSEAFKMVQECEGVDRGANEFGYTFYPFLVDFVKELVDRSLPGPHFQSQFTPKLKLHLKSMLLQEPRSIEWMPHGDEAVETVLNKAIAEAYSHAGRLGDLSHPFVSAVIKKLAKKLIGICVNVKGSSVGVQACRSMVLMLLAEKNIEDNSLYQKSCKNHLAQTKRRLLFEEEDSQ
jgi:hypothetical protein